MVGESGKVQYKARGGKPVCSGGWVGGKARQQSLKSLASRKHLLIQSLVVGFELHAALAQVAVFLARALEQRSQLRNLLLQGFKLGHVQMVGEKSCRVKHLGVELNVKSSTARRFGGL
ncbi:MAG: hypothetical protein ACKVQQ_18045 [Burkholderiales bacterium]